MKKSNYCFDVELNNNTYLHFSPMQNAFLLLNKPKHHSFCNTSNDQLDHLDSDFLKALKTGGFVVDDNFNEELEVLSRREHSIFDDSMYNIVINTTLDCNLSCWYCYEKKIKNSKLSNNIIDGIKKYIINRYKNKPYQILKISFFGGEPLLQKDKIKELLNYSKEFCETNNIKLIADFTTNATLLDEEFAKYLSQFTCHFQITLDGDEEYHNLTKVDKLKKSNTYRKAISALKNIVTIIPDHYIALRINFDNHILGRIESILNDIDFLKRRQSYIILKKVWQIRTKDINPNLLKKAIAVLFEREFLVDYYLMPKGSVCFAERESQVLFNYDGGIFKCTTLCNFNEENSFGKFDVNNGKIIWNKDKLNQWFENIQPISCRKCNWFPVCLGICNNQLRLHTNEEICTFDANNLTQKEYLIYLLNYSILYNKLFSVKKEF